MQLIPSLTGWPTSMKRHLCTSGTCWKGGTRLWLEQHVSQMFQAVELNILLVTVLLWLISFSHLTERLAVLLFITLLYTTCHICLFFLVIISWRK